LESPFQLRPPSPKPKQVIQEKKEIALEDMDISQLIEFINTQKGLMSQVDAKENEVRRALSKHKEEIQKNLELF
jgi:hypothetical protein